MPEQI